MVVEIMVVEIVAGVIVLILAIIGIAKLAARRGGGGGGVDIDSAMKMASNSKRALIDALYKHPEKMGDALEYLQKTAAVSKRAMGALSQKMRTTRAKVDAAMLRKYLPGQDAMDYFDNLLEITEVTSLAAAQYRRGNITGEQARNYIAAELKEQEASFKRHYALRHAGFD